jgi:hypothetical protein
MASLAIRHRDLCPLPNVHMLCLDPSQTRNDTGIPSEHAAILAWANDGVLALNQLSTRGETAAAHLEPPRSAITARARVEEAYLRTSGDIDLQLQGADALRDLTQKASVYGSERADILPYSKGLVSWPGDGCKPIDLASVLEPEHRKQLLSWTSSMLRDPEEARTLLKASAIRRPHCDAALFRSPKVYGTSWLSSRSGT